MINKLAKLIETETIQELKRNGLGCEANLANAKTYVRPGNKYTKVDVGPSGRYMVVNETGEIYGIKAYGVIHRGHFFGTLDTIDQYYWGGYTAVRKAQTQATGGARLVAETVTK